jgi:HlyD family secretion protein
MVQNTELEKPSWFPPPVRAGILLGISSMIIMGASVIYFTRPQIAKSPQTISNSQARNPTVNALGRLEPKGEVIIISAPGNGVAGSRIAKLLVAAGEQVQAGQVIAILDGRDRIQASLTEAQKQVQIARSRLAQVKAGAKQGEISARRAIVTRLQAELAGQRKTQQAEIERLQAQLRGETATAQATINRLQAELKGQRQILAATVARIAAEQRNAQAEVQRYEGLFQQGVISLQEVDRRRTLAETTTQQLVESQAIQSKTIATLQQQIQESLANRDKTIVTLQQEIQQSLATRDKTIATLQQQIQEAKATLEQTAEIRPTDVATAVSEVDSANATVKRIQTELEQAYIRAPSRGRILRVQTRPGETVGVGGILELAQTDQMYAVAEIFESDISKIRPGQTAIISSPSNAFSDKLQGTVEEIGLQVAKKDILDTDPTAATDARVIEVKIRLNQQASQKVASLTNLQVNVEVTL